ncbi:MAG TPA: cytochrome P450 [Myxococcota bacterium]|nr:cytochrome P450 [Myxococcota bacterium]
MSESPLVARPSKGQAGADPWSVPLDRIDPADPELFETNTLWGYFERLRKEDPVHYCAEGEEGPYWSVTRYDDIVYVEKNPEIFSSEPTIVLPDPDPDFPLQAGFISMDGPRHDAQRKVVQPVSSPRNLKKLEPLIRERVVAILDGLPEEETFDWVDRVSIELTTGMLATMFDFPWEERRKLTFWSDMATASDDQLAEMGCGPEARETALRECLATFTKLWKEREGTRSESLDFITAMANSEAMRGLAPLEYLGTLVLLIVGGNDTTRNSISGGVLALNEHPAEYEKLRKDPSLIPNMVNEIIRWQTPLAYMRRTATRDTELGGKRIARGDRVLMWYVSANRDDSVIERADEFLIDRKNSKQHLSFGLGVHFCMGSRLAEMQLRVLWEEIMKRFRQVEVVGDPVRVKSSFVKGFAELPVRLHRG